MSLLDLVLCGSLALLLAAWWLSRRQALLWTLAGAVSASASVALLLDRWQAGLVLGTGLLAASLLLLRQWRKRPPQRRPWISGGLLGLSGALAVATLYQFALRPLPEPEGPHAVGVRDFELVDDSRRGVMHAAADQPRRLLVRVWYPATATDSDPLPYFSAAQAATTARGMGSLLGFAPLLSHARLIRTHGYQDAPLRADLAPLPTLFFSHGYTGFAWQNTVLMEHLASHGYVIYAVQHTFDASPTLFADGQVAPLDPELVAAMSQGSGFSAAMLQGFTRASLDERLDGQLRNVEQNLAERARIAVVSAPTWLADRLFVHDRLQAGAVPDSVAEVVAASDFSRTGEMGMSYGGSVSGAVCMVDPRCAAMVNLDGGDFHFTPFAADLPVPLLMLHTDIARFYRYFDIEAGAQARSFNDFSYERFAQAGLRPDIHRLQLRGAAHNGLTDLPWLIRRPLGERLLGDTPTEILLGVPNAFVLGFFDRYLRQQHNGFPDSQYARYRDWALPYDNSPVRRWWLGKSDAERADIEQRIASLKQASREALEH